MAQLKANYRITSLTFTAADVDIANDRITVANHGLRVGDAIGIAPTAAGTIPAGLAVTTPYNVIVVDASTISLAASYADAFAGTAVNITSVGVGTQTLYVGGIGRVLLQPFPLNGVIRNVSYDVITTFDSAATSDGAAVDAAAIGLELITISGARVIAQSVSIMDETDATATISNGANGWDAGVGSLDALVIPDFATVDDDVKPTDDTWLAVSLEDNGEVVRVGEANIIIDYYVSFTSA